MRDVLIFISAAFFEIFGCYAFWLYFRLHKSFWWVMAGVVSLIIFAFLLTKVNVSFAGRAYAVYGGIYIAASFLWLYLVEGITADKWDIIGAIICIIGALIILLTPR
ncbi:MAG: YnfA family protein [Bacteroidales bacterium]|nr:YnfA family protein [Bacteroidales bacterium]